MRRTQIQIEEETYQLLRRRAFERGKSVASIVRELLNESLGAKRGRSFRIEDLRFIGIGHSEPSPFDPISERHDEYLGEALYQEIIEKARQGSEAS